MDRSKWVWWAIITLLVTIILFGTIAGSRPGA